jgi:cyclopropane fatty-acyl-phospholipid synthase-like methyltransferase
LILEALLLAVLIGVFCVILFLRSHLDTSPPKGNPQEFFTFKDKELEQQWSGKKMPMETFIEAFFDEKIDMNDGVDLHEMLRNHRKDFFKFSFTQNHVKFFLSKFLVQAVMHTKLYDFDDVATTYNLGNDFYKAFLGESMVYTSGIYTDRDGTDTLEHAQENKMNIVAKKIGMKPGDKHLDIGCGWGTFVMHCAREFGTDSFGITIAKEQVDYAKDSLSKGQAGEGKDRAKIGLMDYRDIPHDQYDKITCLEMAEHVGVKNFQKFMRQVKGLLKDDGLFYLQICGLRPTWHFEDFVWGLFMARYIFPAADASCPISWVTTQMEQAGFEVHSVENVSVHYTKTIFDWYVNWKKNEKEMIAKYKTRMYRIWLMFLGWSILVGEQGTSQCYQIVANKNLNDYDRKVWRGNDIANNCLRYWQQVGLKKN